MAWRNSPALRTVAETSGAVLVLGLVDFATDFISITQSIGDEKVQHQVGPVMSHKRSLLAEEQQLHGELDRHFVDALTPWLDPVPPNKAREATATKKQTKNFKEGNVHQKEDSSLLLPHKLFSKADLNYKEKIIKEYYEKIQEQKQDDSGTPLEGFDIKITHDNKQEESFSRREIAIRDVQELFWSLLGTDITDYHSSGKKEDKTGEQVEGMHFVKPSLKHPLEEKSEGQQLRPEERFLLFPNLKKFKEATNFPSLENHSKEAHEEAAPIQGPQPAGAPEIRIEGNPANTLICRLLGANVDMMNHLEALEDDFFAADERLEQFIIDLGASFLPPEEAVSRCMREIYLASIALTGYFYAVRKLWPLSGATTNASNISITPSTTPASSLLAESRLAANTAASRLLYPLLQPSGGAQVGLLARILASPLVLLPLVTMYASKVLSNDEATQRWQTLFKRVAYVLPSQLEIVDKERSERRGDHDFESLFAISRTPVWPGATVEDPFTWTRIRFTLLSKPLAETILFTGVLFRSLLQIPGLNRLGLATVNLLSAAVYGTYVTEHTGQHQASNWYEAEGGIRDYGLFRVAMTQQLVLQCLYMTTSRTFLSLGRPLAYLIAANTCMLFAEMKSFYDAPGFRMDEFGPYRSLVEIWVKNMQATYFRLSREPFDEATRRLSTHCAAYIFWLRGSAEPLQVARDEVGVANVKDAADGSDIHTTVVDDEDLLDASLSEERKYRHTQEKAKKECTLLDLHSFLVAADHVRDTLTLHRDPSTKPEALPPFEQWQISPQNTLHTLNLLNSDAILQTVFGPSASAAPSDKSDIDKAVNTTSEARDGGQSVEKGRQEVSKDPNKSEDGCDHNRARALLDMNNKRVRASQARQPPTAFGFGHLTALLDASYRHAWFEFLKLIYRGRKLTFDEIEGELPKLLKMIESLPGSLSPGSRHMDNGLSQMQLLDSIVARRAEQADFPSDRKMPSLLDYVPMTWDNIDSDTTHEAMLDLLDGMYSRLRAERVRAAMEYGHREGPKFWHSRAGKGRPTRSEMAKERDKMLRHVSAATSRDCHGFLESLGFTRYRLSLSTHRFSQRDPSKQLEKLTHSWETYLKSKEHYEEVHKAFIDSLMKAKPRQRYFDVGKA